jgi:hypothetical protein
MLIAARWFVSRGRGHRRGDARRVLAGELTEPFSYGSVSTPGGVQERHDVNNWIRHTNGGYSPLFDFEPVVEDPRFPDHLWPSYNSGDSLHPNPAGQRAMADGALFGVLKSLAGCRTR